jgi:hypothetical protein
MSDSKNAFLQARGTDSLPHTGRSFLEHLHGTARLLKIWGCKQFVQDAGLFHSVYGTEFYPFDGVLLSERSEIAALIGRDAEELSYLFCIADRPAAWIDAVATGTLKNRISGESLPVTKDQLLNLVAIECANMIEQGAGHDFLKAVANSFCQCEISILPTIHQAIDEFLKSSIAARLKAVKSTRLLVRTSRADDVAELVQLGRELHAEGRYRQEPFILETVREFVLSYLNAVDRACFVVQQRQEIVAFMFGRLEQTPFSTQHVAIAQYWYGKPNHRGLLALRLISAFKEWARKQRAIELRLDEHSGLDMERSRRLYAKLGMRCSGLSMALRIT